MLMVTGQMRDVLQLLAKSGYSWRQGGTLGIKARGPFRRQQLSQPKIVWIPMFFVLRLHLVPNKARNL